MTKKTTTTGEYLASGKNSGVLPYSPQFAQNEGYIPSPFSNSTDSGQDPTLERQRTSRKTKLFPKTIRMTATQTIQAKPDQNLDPILQGPGRKLVRPLIFSIQLKTIGQYVARSTNCHIRLGIDPLPRSRCGKRSQSPGRAS